MPVIMKLLIMVDSFCGGDELVVCVSEASFLMESIFVDLLCVMLI